MEDKLAYEDRNSRVIGAIGAEALQKFHESSVLLIGLRGLGAEIGKSFSSLFPESNNQSKIFSFAQQKTFLFLESNYFLFMIRIQSQSRTWGQT